MTPIRVTVWNEGRHEKTHEKVQRVYPNGIHGAIAEGLEENGFAVRVALQDEPEHGLTEQVLAETDVLTWWGHMAHQEVADEIVDRVHKRVLDGMGLIVLHSGHHAKIFKRLLGTTCDLTWRQIGERERVWVINPAHPIADGLPNYFEIPHHEMYGEPFAIPEPDSLIFTSWFQGGEVFRSGCCYYRGRGKLFYFSPGHETFPIYYQPEIRKVIANAVRWAAPTNGPEIKLANRREPLEKITVTESAEHD
ncbi:ThuA domain-containing protein [Kamptonema cortianum]|nr:ThuA domain-containing protein [Kamptonema cortianum]